MIATISPIIVLLFGGFMWTALLIVGTILTVLEKGSEKIQMIIWEIFKLLTGGLMGFLFGSGGGA